MENIKIKDESGDKKYFTIIPNYIYNHSTLYDREVYCQMKRIAGENGTCWKSQKNLADQCGISINRLKKSIEYLIEHKWIKFNGKKVIKTVGGKQEVNEYSISDLWKMNNDFYQGVSSDDTPTSKGVSSDCQRGITNEPKGVSPNDDKEEPIKKNLLKKNSSVIKDDEFSFSNSLKEMLNSKQIHIQIIGIYWKWLSWKFENKTQYLSALKRDLRNASALKGYSLNRIKKTFKELDIQSDNGKKFNWNLGTVHKYIDGVK